jgi:hypothetical protein
MIRLCVTAITLMVSATIANAGDDRFQRYYDSVSRCGVVGYCKTTASDMLLRGPTGGRGDPFRYRDRKDACRHARRWHGSTCRVHYQPRGAYPRMYVDIVPSPEIMTRPDDAKRLSGDHFRSCTDRYRSYRPADDTFQPNKGPRKRCNSPFS